MQRAFEKIIERLSNKRERCEDLANQSNFDGYAKEEAEYLAMTKMCDNAIEIVNEVASEYFKENYFNLDNTKLHDCPKCGEKASHRVNKKGSWACGCFKCGLFKSSYDHIKAIQAWEDYCGEYCGEYCGGWIPCSERLPENNRVVLCWVVSKTIASGETFIIGSCSNNKFWFLQTYEIGHHHFPVKDYEVVAWCELPEPYKAESEE